MFDVAIAGGGPAGWTTALGLARRGARVCVLDPALAHATASNEPKIGESLPGAVSRLLARLDLPALRGDVHARIGGSISLWAGARAYHDAARSPDGAGWRLDRRAFERDLATAARHAGAEQVCARVRGVQRRAGAWRIDTDTGSVFARFVVDASGRSRVLARRSGAAVERRPPLVALWAIGAATLEARATDRTLTETTDDGWWYGAHLPGGRPVAIFHTSPRTARALVAAPPRWCDALARTRLLAQHLSPRAFRGAALRASDARPSAVVHPCGDGWACCGDAAWACDPIASAGIFHALATAEMLARGLATDDLRGYAERSAAIRSTSERHRTAYYREAKLHHRSAFWSAH